MKTNPSKLPTSKPPAPPADKRPVDREDYRGERSGIQRDRCGGGWRVTRQSENYNGD